MYRLARWALVAVVAVAMLSAGAHALVENGPSGHGTAGCAFGEIYVFPVDDDSPRGNPATYGNLSEREQRAIDRARARTNRTASVDPTFVDELPSSVVVDGRLYRVDGWTSNCPLVAGLPRWSNGILLVPFGIYEVFSPLYLPGAAVLSLGVAYRYVDDWLRFD